MGKAVGTKLSLDRVNLPIRICDLLRRRIIANELPFGAKLTEDSLAKELGTSRTPIREAFNRLAQEGLVTAFHLREFRVKAPDLKTSRTAAQFEMGFKLCCR